MPAFSSSSSIRAASESHALTLKVTHNFGYGLPSDEIIRIKGRLPKELDVLWLSDIVIKITGSLDEHPVDAADISRSGLLEHLQNQLRTNASQLGLNTVSRPYIDEQERCSQMTLTPSRSLPCTSRPHVNLVSLHLAYTWKIIRRKDVGNSIELTDASNPFSPALYLPIETILTRVTKQLFTYHLVGRYPLIFGSWCKRLDLEMGYFPSIASSIAEIMNRSQNATFVSKCKRLIKVSHRRHNRVLQASTAVISSCIELGICAESEREIIGSPSAALHTDEEVICESLEQLFRVGAPQRRFKPKASYSIPSLPERDDDDLVGSSQNSTISTAGSNYPLPSFDIPDIDVACPFPVRQTLLDNTDGFLAEEWPEDDTLSLMSADDTSPSYAWHPKVPSDRSLINTTPLQAPLFTHYHDNEVDCQSPDLEPGMFQCGLAHSDAFLEDTENSAVVTSSLPSLSHHAAHDLPRSQNFVHLTLDHDMDVCQVASEDFAILDVVDSPAVSEDVGSDSLLFSLDDILDFSDTAVQFDQSTDATTDVEVSDQISSTLAPIDTDCFLADLWDL